MTLSNDTRLNMYWFMLLARRLDEFAWELHRERKIAFHLSGIGHEAIQVGAAFALRPGYDWIAPYYRDLALLLALGLTPLEFLLSLYGKLGDPNSGGRQMPEHWSLKRANVISCSSTAAAQTSQAVGIAQAIRLRTEDKVVVNCVGEGATTQGSFYESVNWASLHKLPVIFLVENNLYAISLRQEKQMPVERVADKAKGLGLPGLTLDGNKYLEVYQAVHEATQRARAGDGPTLIEARTYRITPHSSDDDDRSYRPRAEVETYRAHDPLVIAHQDLITSGLLNEKINAQLEARVQKMIAEAQQNATMAEYPEPLDPYPLVFAPGDQPCLNVP
jgi:2-oxoisovalerate dehydrogenase E1 component alpha subunit